MWNGKYIVDIILPFLPAYSEIVELGTTPKQPAVGAVDLDGDGVLEIVGAFYWRGENYIIVLKCFYGTWQVVNVMKGKGYGITYFGAAPVTSPSRNNLIVGWQVASHWSDLSVYEWTDNGLQDLIVGNRYYGMIDVEDMGEQDGLSELALWKHDTGVAYRVEVFRWSGTEFELAMDVYPDYFKKVERYYKNVLKQQDSTTYWYYLADAQIKRGKYEEALTSIDKALSFDYPYPGEEELLTLKKELTKLRNQPDSYEPFVNKDDIDLSSIQYMTSEKERDPQLEKALIKEFEYTDEGKARYYYNKVDLDGDGEPETFVYLVGPYFCGTGGCSAAIFKEQDGDYSLLTRFSVVNNPIIISDTKTNGYKDIIMNVYGGGIEPFFARLTYNGITYPGNPSVQPKVEPGTKLEGVAIVAHDLGESSGIELTESRL
ncbi:tetratricopeptide repeat protein [Pontibacillus salipaludis]|uniref:tetratricopeptide repeat protein n=1 Tax=Pontibacillus salipaludis TaxID=1697394 RepID=UPI0031ED377B